jgi:hypothetical protein
VGSKSNYSCTNDEGNKLKKEKEFKRGKYYGTSLGTTVKYSSR